MGRKKTRAADIKRRLAEDDKPESPFASIKLVEKKEPEKKKPLVKPAPKKPSEIVQGYDPSSSFADILYSYEHTGNPYTMPSKARKASIASSKTDFGAILDKWEGRGKETSKRKTPHAEVKKSTYTPTKSFADILSSFEGGKPAPQKKETSNERVEDFPDEAPLFRKESEDEKRSPDAAWSIFGGNDSFVRKQEPPEEAPAEEVLPAPKRISKPYHPEKSFADILRSYEEKGSKKPVAVPDVKPMARQPETAEKPLSDNLFKEENDEEKRAPEAVWSVFGNNRIPERRNPDEKASDSDSAAAEDVSHSSYEKKGAFPKMLSAFEQRGEKTFDEIMKEKGDVSEKRPQLTISKLRTMLPQATLDLHGETVSEAEASIKAFLEECVRNKIRKISIITGKGLHSEDGIGVLRDTAIRVLDESGIVSEKCSAPLSAGGAGALWIILKA